MKFSTAHGRSRLGVGSAKCIGSYGRKGVPRPPVILVLLSKNYPPPLPTFRGQDKTFSRLLCVDWTNFYHTAARRLVCSHRLQCFTVLPISLRSDDCTIKIWQTRILSIGELVRVSYCRLFLSLPPFINLPPYPSPETLSVQLPSFRRLSSINEHSADRLLFSTPITTLLKSPPHCWRADKPQRALEF